MRQILLLTLSTLFLISTPLHPKAEDVNAGNFPKLVECKNSKNCNQDPKALEQFVLTTYKWFLLNEKDLPQYTFPDGDSPRMKRFRTLYTPSYLAWIRYLNTYSYPGDAPYNPNYCSSEATFIICAQDWDDSLANNLSAQKTEINFDEVENSFSATIHLYINSKNSNRPYLNVFLKNHDGFWKIDRIKEASD